MPKARRTWIALTLLATVLGACAYKGGVDNPVIRKATWFSYVAGDDLADLCKPGGLPRYRFVYNAVYAEQVRAYDLQRLRPGDGATLVINVFGGGGVMSAPVNILEPMSPWAARSAEVKLSEAEYLALIRAVEADGFGKPAPAGLTVPSWEFYWAVSACADGQFHFNVFLHPTPEFERLTFPGRLFAADKVDVAINKARPINAAEKRLRQGGETNNDFDLRVGSNGRLGTLTLF
jgi:hypothetical protein